MAPPTLTPAEAAGLVRAGDRIYVGSNAGQPVTVMQALMDRVHELRDLEFVHGLTFGVAPHVDRKHAGRFRTKTFFIGANMREAVAEGRVEFVPIFLSQIPELFRGGGMPLDVAIVQVSPPDDAGQCSLGVAVDFNFAAVECARTVIAEVNPRMPRTAGPNSVPVDRFAALVPVDTSLPSLERRDSSDVFDRIGRHIAGLIEDGATLQMGIGEIPNAVLANLGHHRDLGIHTEMFSDGLIPLVKRGVVTGARKTLHRGKIIVTFAVGSPELYAFVDRNADVEFHPIEYVNDPFVIARNDDMVAINAAIEVDLTGQVCADSIGERLYSGIGGQVDFIRGAARSRGGKPIIALPSTATPRGGTTVSRIVPRLKPGAGVVTSRGDVRYVVTEWGVAQLHGRSLRERAQDLIAIADPAFRTSLQEAARARGLL